MLALCGLFCGWWGTVERGLRSIRCECEIVAVKRFCCDVKLVHVRRSLRAKSGKCQRGNLQSAMRRAACSSRDKNRSLFFVFLPSVIVECATQIIFIIKSLTVASENYSTLS